MTNNIAGRKIARTFVGLAINGDVDEDGEDGGDDGADVDDDQSRR